MVEDFGVCDCCNEKDCNKGFLRVKVVDEWKMEHVEVGHKNGGSNGIVKEDKIINKLKNTSLGLEGI